ncbi:putative peroxisomal-coenzyme a synthetase [Venturia nashicola]|uniref:Putative peroxisomal-coenzyme a synthetase n=1 Tax=Venturia nashicola TaxID=86259 RepID=A0A4Z1PWT0_9PEZI|nr:putative peroxisomal-coenzyme a synthetase [Venturia nashicola]TLD39658.1 putative peroxisomal-coenzyme a synthetase [Venturia nashicola]
MHHFTPHENDASSALVRLREDLASGRESFSVYETIREYTRCWKQLPESVKSGCGHDFDHLIEETLLLVKARYSSLLDLFPVNEGASIIDGRDGRALSKRRLEEYVRAFTIPSPSAGKGTVVALAIPNGPLAGLLSMSVVAHYTLAPLNPTSSVVQFRSDLLCVGANVVLVLQSDVLRLGLDESWALQHGIEVHVVCPIEDMTCTIKGDASFTSQDFACSSLNRPDDTCLILMTSGTSGTRKIVPITLHSIISGVAFVGDSWQLTSRDVCLNMMPLNHVGGLVRNLLAPILLGGSTICCSAFDPNLFWDLVDTSGPTWYYASPSMHAAILDAAPSSSTLIRKSQIRMVCNAAGGLLPSLAQRLHDTFNCPVLPSYGMTECMPISTPPIDYKLDRPGTSGISTGPELAILDRAGSRMEASVIGRICVRGNPLFAGYLVDGRIDNSAFTANGWFDTGDLGFMDENGYLFITGRSKEVINRGGEIISPFEIEEAVMTTTNSQSSPIHGRISAALAFSVPHDTLQESVGVVLVSSPGKPRVDLRQLHDALKTSLHSTKLPIVVIYMDAVPTRNGKLCRVGLAERMGVLPFRDDTKLSESHFEAQCPPPDTPVVEKISKQICHLNEEQMVDVVKSWYQNKVDVVVKTNSATGLLDAIVAPKFETSQVHQKNTEQLRYDLQKILHGYLVPAKVMLLDAPFPRDLFGSIDYEILEKMLAPKITLPAYAYLHPLESHVRNIYSKLLDIPSGDIPSDADFFELGGNSLKAGRLLHTFRKELNVRMPIDRLFAASRVCDICDYVDEYRSLTSKESPSKGPTPLPGCVETFSSTRPLVLLLHLVPLAIFTPLQKVIFWIAFLKTWSILLDTWWQTETSGHLSYLLISMFIARAIQSIVMPMFSIFAKWVIIGRYKEGLYPMWSSYHSRWWIVQKAIHIFGMGMFEHTNWSRVLFYRLLGAKIGKNVTIEPSTILGEYDLLEFGDNVELDRCICRPFAVERNTSMFLGKIRMGKNSAAGLKTIIAPGTDLPEDVCLGVNSSSWEWKEATDSNYDQLQSRIPQPHWILWFIVGIPIIFTVKAVSLLPWLGAISGLRVSHHPERGADMMLYLVSWFANPVRVGYHFLARTIGALFTPIVYLATVIMIKLLTDTVFGKIRPGTNASRRHLDRFRMALMAKLIPQGNLIEVTGFFGAHYEMTSMIVRALGARVGKRVYWPGTGPSIQNFDLIEVGDDVVFGSRSHLVTSDGVGSSVVQIKSGAMVADRVIVQPGCKIGERAVLGSGALTRRNNHYAPESTWIGSKAGGPIFLNSPCPSSASPIPSVPSSRAVSPFLHSSSEHGGRRQVLDVVSEKDSNSLDTASSSNSFSQLLHTDSVSRSNAATTPFGRAFYEHQAPYHVFGMAFITFYSVLTSIIISIYWNAPTILALQTLNYFAQHSPFAPVFTRSIFRPFFVFGILFLAFSILQIIFSIQALALSISMKWIAIGQREQGDYDWDKSSYCQRWQLLLTAEKIRRKNGGGEDILTSLTGTYFFALFYRLQGAQIGKDCALFAGGEVSTAFTEPDLLTLGDRVAVDDASLVAHINTRGNFKLNPLVVGDRCVLRTGSRLLSGASMGDDSCLLEHTLVMAGDEVDAGTTLQGWPGDVFCEERVLLGRGREESDIVTAVVEGNNMGRKSFWFSWFDFRNLFWRGKGKYTRIGVEGESWALT